jgi:hypothetical protein
MKLGHMKLKNIIYIAMYLISIGLVTVVVLKITESQAEKVRQERQDSESNQPTPIALSGKAACATEYQNICGRCYVECPYSNEPKCIAGKQIEEIGEDEETKQPYMSRQCTILPKCYCLEKEE